MFAVGKRDVDRTLASLGFLYSAPVMIHYVLDCGREIGEVKGKGKKGSQKG